MVALDALIWLDGLKFTVTQAVLLGGEAEGSRESEAERSFRGKQTLIPRGREATAEPTPAVPRGQGLGAALPSPQHLDVPGLQASPGCPPTCPFLGSVWANQTHPSLSWEGVGWQKTPQDGCARGLGKPGPPLRPHTTGKAVPGTGLFCDLCCHSREWDGQGRGGHSGPGLLPAGDARRCFRLSRPGGAAVIWRVEVGRCCWAPCAARGSPEGKSHPAPKAMVPRSPSPGLGRVIDRRTLGLGGSLVTLSHRLGLKGCGLGQSPRGFEVPAPRPVPKRTLP